MLIVFKLPELLRSCSKRIMNIQYFNYLKSLCFERKIKRKLKYSKYQMGNEIFFLILPKYNSTQIQQLKHWYSKCNSKVICLSTWHGQANLNFTFHQTAIAVSLFLFRLSFAYNPAFHFNKGKKLWRHITFSSTCFCYYRKHPNNDNMICPLPSSSCFQQHFHDWFYVLTYNSDLSKLE